VDLDADCVLNGQLERVFWFAPAEWKGFAGWGWLGDLPRELVTLAGVTALVAAFIAVFFKELRIVSFDPALSTSLGIPAGAMHFALMVLVAASVVAAFEAVGSILVIGALICPAATARLLTNRLSVQVWLSVALAAGAGIAGYILGVHGPVWLGGQNALSAAGMITVVSGGMLALAIVAAPEHGIVAKRLRQGRLAVSIAREDLLSTLYRREEGGNPGLSLPEAVDSLGGGRVARRAAAQARARAEVGVEGGRLALTDRGREEAQALVRAHRLWESFLVGEAGLAADHVHPRAEVLEHITDTAMAARLRAAPASGKLDPHGRPIPE
jgi:manganese/zinc/iron transport system permease protein